MCAVQDTVGATSRDERLMGLMDLNYPAWRFWLDVIEAVVIAALFVHTWVINRTKANRAAIDRVDERISGLSERMMLLERDVRHLPDHGDLAELHEKVNVIASSLGKIEGELSALVRNLSLIHQHLLDEVKR